MRTISGAVARRMALAAQGFTTPRPDVTPTRRHLNRVLDQIQLLQLDSVNVAVRAHYAPLFARLGPYPRELVDHAAWVNTSRKPRLLVEYWAHAACLLPIDDWPLLRHQMRDRERRYLERADSVANTAPHLAEDVLAVVKEHGPIGAGAIEEALGAGAERPRGAGKAPGGWWNRSDVKLVCEWLFATGELTTGSRRSFERLYDLPERVLPASALSAPEIDRATATRELIARSATALGVATEPDLRDYYRLSPADSRQAVAELVAEGLLEPVRVRGWQDKAYLRPGAKMPRAVTGRALLCPFDPLIWERARTERIFGFHYRIEIYVPEPKRVFGYYVFPFLLDGELVARVDLKADRAAGVLRVHGAFAEPGADLPRVIVELAAELRSFAEWLGLSGVAVAERGDLAAGLAAVS
ncbi:MAG: winged helix-turn-helix domain-containing protein [Actinophytocola sp.]|nr:winged helix-turn-helix domain-containing protein [Actinophytocola sp.]